MSYGIKLQSIKFDIFHPAMAIKAIKPRTTRMSFVCNGERGEGYFRGIIQKYNEDQKRLLAQKKAANPNSRVAPLFVGKLYYVVVKGKTQCLAYTQGGDQFEFSKWYEFISASFQDVEAMEDHDKFEQIKSFGRNLQRYACIKFEESLPSKRGADELDSGHAQTPAKQMALGDSFQPVRVGDGVMKQSRIIAVTVDCGAKQNLKFDGVGEDVRESSGDAVDNLFRKPDDDYVRKALTAFLTGKVPIYKPAKVIEGGAPGEKASDKCIRGKRSLNGSSAGWKCIQTMFSLVVKTSQGRDVLHGKLSPKHMEDLMCLDRLLNPVSWQGVLTGYMQPDSQELRYDIPLPGVDAEIARRACFTELWRRALNLEGALAKMTLFFATIIGRTPAAGLSVVSRQTVANVAALISAGAGLYPEDGCFWKKRVPDYIQKLSSIEGDRDKDVSALIDWLADNRGNAFIALHPKAHELDVLLPAMAYIYSIRESLGNLRDLDALKQILDDLRLEIQSRTELYASCCAWLVVYGAKLTRYRFSS